MFENRETPLFQIQEMCRAERIIDDAKVQEEIDVYSGGVRVGTLRRGEGEAPGTFRAGRSTWCSTIRRRARTRLTEETRNELLTDLSP
ncbi:MAG TPA: DUF3501 family protein [Methylomirabilota bacterium]|nr:DUF3501 family protein [Methylomirabilota bacterium]